MQLVLDALRKGLRERGYVEGQNIIVEYRSTGGRARMVRERQTRVRWMACCSRCISPSTLAAYVLLASSAAPL